MKYGNYHLRVTINTSWLKYNIASTLLPKTMSQDKHSSDRLASLASKALQDGRCNDNTKSLAGSVLSQAADGNRETTSEMASLASKILKDTSSSEIAKELAGSVLSQS
jgi:hypothetical protein